MSEISKLKLPDDSSIFSIKDGKARTVQYSGTLASGSWVEDEDVYTYTFSLATLTCGSDGTISPAVNWVTNSEEYRYITEAIATPSEGIVFTAEHCPTADIDITI